jgi:acyl-CoA reductase-like NAD-dependent aldehyde dehydrogenase
MRQDEIATLVAEVLKRLDKEEGLRTALKEPPAGTRDAVVFPSVDAAVAAAQKAQKSFQELGVEARRRIIKAMRKVSIANAENMARMAWKK